MTQPSRLPLSSHPVALFREAERDAEPLKQNDGFPSGASVIRLARALALSAASRSGAIPQGPIGGPEQRKESNMTHSSHALPPDPEGMNERRTAWAGLAIAAFIAATGTDEEDSLGDLLANLMHWADRNEYDFDAALDRARMHYEAEIAAEEVA